MFNIDFMTSNVIQLLLHAKITFSQRGATDLQKNKHLAPGLIAIEVKLQVRYADSNSTKLLREEAKRKVFVWGPYCVFPTSGYGLQVPIIFHVVSVGCHYLCNRYRVPHFLPKVTHFNLFKVCSLSEWCFIISIAVPGDHSHLRCTGFAGGH